MLANLLHFNCTSQFLRLQYHNVVMSYLLLVFFPRVGTWVVLYYHDLKEFSPMIRPTCCERRRTGHWLNLAGSEYNYHNIHCHLQRSIKGVLWGYRKAEYIQGQVTNGTLAPPIWN